MSNPICPDCKSELKRKTGQGNVQIWSCSNFPKCKYFTRKLDKENVSMFSIPEPIPDNAKADLRQAKRAQIKKQVKTDIKNFFIRVIAGLALIAFSWFSIQKVFEKMSESFVETAKHVQTKALADVAKARQPPLQTDLIIQTPPPNQLQAKAEAQRQAIEEQARKMELKQMEFEREFKPRTECNDPDLEWSKFVKCKNDKITARENFYRTQIRNNHVSN